MALVALALILCVGIVSAAVLPYFGRIVTTVDVKQAVLLDGQDYTTMPITETPTVAGGESFCRPHWLQSQTSVPVELEFETTISPIVGDEITVKYYDLSSKSWVFETADTGNPEGEDAVDLMSMYKAPITVELSYEDDDVKFKVTLPTSGFVDETNGNIAFAFDNDADGVADWHVKYQPGEIEPAIEEDWGYAYVEAGEWKKWFTVPSDITVEHVDNVFTVAVPIDMLGGCGSTYRFAIDVWHVATPGERAVVDAQFYKFVFPDVDITVYPSAPWYGSGFIDSELYYETTVGKEIPDTLTIPAGETVPFCIRYEFAEDIQGGIYYIYTTVEPAS
jgi:hypothetical protein